MKRRLDSALAERGLAASRTVAQALVIEGKVRVNGQVAAKASQMDSENEDHGIRSHHFMGNRWGNSGNSVRLNFSGLQNHCRW